MSALAIESTFELACDALEGAVVLRARGREGMNELSAWSLDVVAAHEFSLEDALGAPATLALVDALEEHTRQIGLLVVDLAFEGKAPEGLRYVVALAPAEWLLTQRSGYRIFQEKTTPEIVQAVLVDAGTPANQVSSRLSAPYGVRLHCTQYGETEWSFIERLLAEDGISYWFEMNDDGPVVVLGDSIGSHDGLSVTSAMPFADGTSGFPSRRLSSLELIEEITTESLFVRDYDVRHPDIPIEGAAGDGPLEYYEHPACVLTEKEAGARAKVRLEQLRRWKARAEGRSDSMRMQPGRLVDVGGASDDSVNRRYLVVSVEHTYERPSPHSVTGVGYGNQVLMVPADETPHRPAVPANVPKVEGLEPAITTGAPGEEIHVNDLGELKIRFPWDRSGIFDDKSSTWVRCMQMGLGGAMLLPRVGWEVPVMYVDGNPDRPVVLGRLYDAQNVVPHSLPKSSATSALQSATSPGGGTTNELRMSDDAGSMEMFIHASRDQTVLVGGSANTKVGVDETYDVGLSLGLSIKGSQTHSVGASQTINVGTDSVTEVKGGRTELVGGLEMNKITANRAVVVGGGYGEVIGALYGLQCNQANTDVRGGYAQTVAGAMVHTAGLGFNETVAGARAQAVGGVRSIVAGKGYGESVLGPKTVTAGASTVTAGGKMMTGSKAAGTVKAGGSATITASGAIVIQASKITIDVGGSLTAGALSISGGTMKVTKGTTKLDGTIKRKGGSKIE
jgi:type VI secretion system secreted protein VgrG